MVRAIGLDISKAQAFSTEMLKKNPKMLK